MDGTDLASGRADRLRQLVVVHAAGFVLFTSWAFGGQAPFAREVIAWWGTGGMLLFLVLLRRGGWRQAARFLWPLALYDLFVLASCFNPSFRAVMIEGQASLVMTDPKPWLPSSAMPALSARELWQFNGIVLSCFNLLLVFTHRSQVRALLFLLAGNGVVLAIFGTFQKLAGSTGLWFGLVESPQKRFFSTFVYHNHWGAFTLLNATVCLALLFHHLGRTDQRNLWHSPVPMGALATLLLMLSVPLSASRSCSVLIAGLVLVAFAHFVAWLVRSRRRSGRSLATPLSATLVAALLALSAIGFLAREVIAQRTQTTAEQLAQLAEQGTMTSRLVLYRDTWTMAAQKPWFGWGLQTYARVFRVFNTQRAAEREFWVVHYAEAHNDWLQSLAEVGFVGTGCLGLLLLLPVLAVRWRRVGSTLPRYLMAGCLVLLLYAWLEFPFANPAVVLTFFTVFYCAVAYGRLSQARPPDAP